jgi:hypothetical protein
MNATLEREFPGAPARRRVLRKVLRDAGASSEKSEEIYICTKNLARNGLATAAARAVASRGCASATATPAS